MGQKKAVKLGDIAEELGVSIVSVSNALKGKKGVREELRLEILRKAEEMGYEMPEVSVKKEEVSSGRIGVVIAERYVKEYPSFYMDVYKQVAQAAVRQGNLTVLEIIDASREKLEQRFGLFSDIEIQGIIVIGEMNPEFICQIKENIAVPVVCTDFYQPDGDMDYIVSDSFRGMGLLTQKLIDAGHKDIAFVGSPRVTNSIMDRYMGYCKALKVNGLRENRDWLIPDRREDGYGYVIDFELPEKLPTAFVCNCDKCAGILIDKLRRKGIRVPEDISVVGFDHSYSAAEDGLSLTTYENDEKALAQISVNTLMRRIRKNRRPEGIRIVEGKVIEGSTVAVRKER